MTHPGPSHPGPSGPAQPSAPSRGHLPIGADQPPMTIHARIPDSGGRATCGANDRATTTLERAEITCTAAPCRLPRLGEVIRDAERLAAQLLAVLTREYDPASAPADLAWPGHSDITVVDLHLKFATADVRSALDGLGRAAAEAAMPALGSAVDVVFRDPSGAPVRAGQHAP